MSVDPELAWFNTNYCCNLNCEWCYSKNANLINRFMDIDTAKQCIDSLPKLNTLVLIGGEPTIYPDIIELISYAHNKGIKVAMASNGLKFSSLDFCNKLSRAGLNYVDISLKGASEEDYLRYTGHKGLNDALQGYKNISDKVKTSLSYVISSRDINRVISLKSMMEKNQLPAIVFQFLKPSIIDCLPTMSIEEMADPCEDTYHIFQNSDIKIGFEISFPLCKLNPNLLDDLIATNVISSCCSLETGRRIIFDVDFNVMPCNHFIGTPLNTKPIIISEESIKTAWNSKEVIAFRDVLMKYPTKKCVNCKLWTICGGGCPIRWLRTNPNIIEG